MQEHVAHSAVVPETLPRCSTASPIGTALGSRVPGEDSVAVQRIAMRRLGQHYRARLSPEKMSPITNLFPTRVYNPDLTAISHGPPSRIDMKSYRPVSAATPPPRQIPDRQGTSNEQLQQRVQELEVELQTLKRGHAAFITNFERVLTGLGAQGDRARSRSWAPNKVASVPKPLKAPSTSLPNIFIDTVPELLPQDRPTPLGRSMNLPALGNTLTSEPQGSLGLAQNALCRDAITSGNNNPSPVTPAPAFTPTEVPSRW